MISSEMMSIQVLLTAITILQGTFGEILDDTDIEPVDLNFKCVESNRTLNFKSPVLLIHSLLDNLSTWNGIAEALSNRTRRSVCAVDLRNHGGSPWSNRTDVAAMTEDIHHFLNKQRIKNVNIVGSRLGGKVAVDFTLKHPFSVNTAVIEDMRPSGATDAASKAATLFVNLVKEAIDNVPERSTEEEANELILNYLKEKLEENGYDANRVTEDVINNYGVNCSEKCRYQFNIDALAEAFKDPEAFLGKSEGKFNGPTLFIYGTLSPNDVGGDEENIKKLFPNAKLVGVEGADHLLHGIYKQFEDEVVKLLNSRLN